MKRKAFVSRANKTIKENRLIETGDKILVGFSGGPDSTALLLLMIELKKKYSLQVAAFHVNYGQRKEADLDENFCLEFCRKNRIPLYRFKVKNRILTLPNERRSKKKLPLLINKIKNFENRAREIRYYLFKAITETKGYSKIALAHNRDDQAETIILKLIRGAGLEGMKGMSHKRGKIIRPLLDIGKKEILSFLKTNKVSFKIDKSNYDFHFARNKVRHKLIPLIEKEFNPNFSKTISRNSFIFKEAYSYIDDAAGKALLKVVIRKDGNKILINQEQFQVQPLIIKLFLARKIIFLLRGNTTDVSLDLILKSLNFISKDRENIFFTEISGLIITAKNGNVLFKRD